MAGLAPSFGRGAMTNSWVDIKNADVVLVMGGNPAEAHPCGFKWALEAREKRKAKIIVVDPRFNRTAAVADLFAAIRPGTDIAFTGGVIHHLLSNDKIQHEYVKNYTNAAFVLDKDYAFQDGLFSGWEEAGRKYNKTSWAYEKRGNNIVIDPTMQNPRCVLNVMKQHYSRYTPDMVERITGVPKETFLEICRIIATTSVPDRTMTHLYALGWTQHTVGSQNIRSMAVIQLLLGNIGTAGGGINALRGHANVQGITDLGLLAGSLPGYMAMPKDEEQTFAAFVEKRTQKPSIPGQMSYWQNFPKFFVSLMKSWYGNAATKGNDFAYHYLPKADKSYDIMAAFELMSQGKLNGYICQGFNPLASMPHKERVTQALSKLKYLVVIDPMETETSIFWQNHGEYNAVDPSKIQTEVFRLPTGLFSEEEGAFVNSSRCLQWHYQASEPLGEARGDARIMADLFLRIRELYKKEGGAFPDPILNLHWPYRIPNAPSPEELAKELNGSALEDIPDPANPRQFLARAGEQVPGFAALRDNGETACGCWIYAGSWTEKGNMMARRDPSDPSGLGISPNWGFAWPSNRRVLYNRASCDVKGRPWDPRRKLIAWNGKKWAGNDIPDFKPDSKPEEGVSPFIMNPEGVGRLFALDKMAEGPLPEHYEPFETPIGTNPLHPKVVTNPATRIFPGVLESLGKSPEFPLVATTYRLTEHFHFWTKHARINAALQPEFFVEIGEELAKEKGIKNGAQVKVSSKRGSITAAAVVTKRIRPFQVDGKTVHLVGIPIHWGFSGLTRKGYLANTLTPNLGDANVQTPEFKAFLVNLERA